MQLFELKSISRRGCKLSDGSYEVYEQELGIFDSVENAETFMKLVIDKEKKYSQFHCFVIIEKTLNRGLSKKWDNVCEFEGIRSYLPDGTFYCDSPYDDACEKPFRGRPAETIKLKVGDIAWYWDGFRICPCLIDIPPMTDVDYRKRVEELGHEMGLDYSDAATWSLPAMAAIGTPSAGDACYITGSSPNAISSAFTRANDTTRPRPNSGASAKN